MHAASETRAVAAARLVFEVRLVAPTGPWVLHGPLTLTTVSLAHLWGLVILCFLAWRPSPVAR